jgi:hypothetical protein
MLGLDAVNKITDLYQKLQVDEAESPHVFTTVAFPRHKGKIVPIDPSYIMDIFLAKYPQLYNIVTRTSVASGGTKFRMALTQLPEAIASVKQIPYVIPNTTTKVFADVIHNDVVGPNKEATVFLSNLAVVHTETTVFELMKHFGDIIRVDLVYKNGVPTDVFKARFRSLPVKLLGNREWSLNGKKIFTARWQYGAHRCNNCGFRGHKEFQCTDAALELAHIAREYMRAGEQQQHVVNQPPAQAGEPNLPHGGPAPQQPRADAPAAAAATANVADAPVDGANATNPPGYLINTMQTEETGAVTTEVVDPATVAADMEHRDIIPTPPTADFVSPLGVPQPAQVRPLPPNAHARLASIWSDPATADNRPREPRNRTPRAAAGNSNGRDTNQRGQPSSRQKQPQRGNNSSPRGQQQQQRQATQARSYVSVARNGSNLGPAGRVPLVGFPTLPIPTTPVTKNKKSKRKTPDSTPDATEPSGKRKKDNSPVQSPRNNAEATPAGGTPANNTNMFDQHAGANTSEGFRDDHDHDDGSEFGEPVALDDDQ